MTGFRLVRHADNPIITADDVPLACAVFNPGAVLDRNGDVVLLLRVEDARGLSALFVARSSNGIDGWHVADRPLLAPGDDAHAQWGFEDARLTYLPDVDRFAITCTAYGPGGPCVYLAFTNDFVRFDEQGVALPPEDKNAALFPRPIGEHWLLLHRPVVMRTQSADVWLSQSEDLRGWHGSRQVLGCREAGMWDSVRVGIGPPPIETDSGWLLIYHGVRQTVAGSIYRAGAALLDLHDPGRVLSRLDDHILAPTTDYERVGDVGNVVFPTGAIVRDDQLDVYYGAADTSVCVASGSVSSLIAALDEAGGDNAELDGQ
jgi:predicted GH43/DUF377 family glycosyl hydrolase